MGSLNTIVINFLAILTVIGQVFIVLFMLNIMLSRYFLKNKILKKINSNISEYYIFIVIIITTISTLGSLTFSEILNFAPCKLCWYQRIFMYPQLIISVIAYLTNDTLKIRKYILSLSIIGFLIALYHVLLQFFPQILKCSDEVAKCSARQFATFGYITIPVMSATAFLILILISLNLNSPKK